MEQYFSGEDDNTTDYIIEGVMKSLIVSARKAMENPQDYEARSNIMWCATMGLNEITGLSKQQDWEVHNIEHQVGAYTDCPHGLGLAVVSIPYYRYIYKTGLAKFVRFATTIWNVDPAGKTDNEIALAGLDAMRDFIVELGIPTTLRELGTTEEMLEKIAYSTIPGGGYQKLTQDDIYEILKACY
jgi:alcohol dehydrogenase YqhD (iron-dependent ADH family)